jgi:uncharacterized membrane protein (DUF4010 family)
MDFSAVAKEIGIALGLGLLVGLQRERVASPLAGFRTFPLITVSGTIAALLGQSFGGWIVGAGLLALAGLIIVGNLAKQKKGDLDPGLTTEVAMLLMYGVGAYVVVGHTAAAIAIGGGVAVLLHLKPEMHSLAARIGNADFKAIMQFVLVSFVILPVLPDQAYGPYQVLNPHRIWVLVVLIVGISLAGYMVYKFFGEKAGVMMGGILGGMISSTATTVSYARRSRQARGSSKLAAQVILIASTVVFVRVLMLIAATAPASLREAGPPLGAMLGVLMVLSVGTWFVDRHAKVQMPPQGNPTELKSAILFAALFALVTLGVAAAKEHFGQRGLYVVAILSGLTDMDAITLSTTQIIQSGQTDVHTGWRLILAAALANLVFKAGTTAVLGDRELFLRVCALFGAAFAGGVLILLLWPHS